MMKRVSWSTEKKIQTQEKLTHLLLQESSIVFAYIFGSFVNCSNFRDLDLAIYVDPTFISEFTSFEQNLGIKLELDIRIPIDLILLNVAPLSLKFHATKGQLLFSREENTRLQFLEQTRMQYWDFQPIRRGMMWQILHSSNINSDQVRTNMF